MDRETSSWITDLFIGVVVAGTLWGSGAAWGAQVTLAWDPNSEPDLAGYRLHRGQSSGVYDRTVDVGNVTTFTDADLQTDVIYYFVVTAYNTAGLESDPSNEVSFLAPNASPTIGAIDDQSAPQDSVIGPIEFTVGDVDSDPATLAVTATSSNPALVPDANVTLAGAGTDRTITLTPLAESAGTTIITLTVSDGRAFASTQFTLTVTVNQTIAARVVGRHIFYNQSRWDERNAAANALDDAAIATDKTALLPGQTATFANYTSYSSGINGIMVDIAGLAGTLTLADFSFRVGNNSDVATWVAGPAPSLVAVRPGAGVDGADRVTLIWPNWPSAGSIAENWLQVTVRPTLNTGLATSDISYFGNALGDTGNSTSDAKVTLADRDLIRANFTQAAGSGGVVSRYDINRDSKVSKTDADIVSQNLDSASTGLALITVPVGERVLELASTVSLQAVRSMAEDSGCDIAAESVAESDSPVRTPSIVLHGNALQLRHRTMPGQRCRLQSAPRLTGPWTDVPESDRAADGEGNIQIEIPTATEAHAQGFLRWIEIRPRANR
ncbi:MAG TPA: hypothetical protein P5525_19185 [Candidatus Paceibacterota bacterium]|nr:hypothetical protein [Candidatus Paceibacterota bacterium]